MTAALVIKESPYPQSRFEREGHRALELVAMAQVELCRMLLIDRRLDHLADLNYDYRIVHAP